VENVAHEHFFLFNLFYELIYVLSCHFDIIYSFSLDSILIYHWLPELALEVRSEMKKVKGKLENILKL